MMLDPGKPFGGKVDAPEGSMVRGSTWMIAMRWLMRIMGLVSTVILARVLVPEDFGIVAMAMVVVGFLEVMTWTGVDLSLIRNANASRESYDTAWTLQVLQACLLSMVLLGLAPFVGSYFQEPRVVAVIQCLAIKAFVDGLENIGTVAFRKELDFAREFRFGVLKKGLTFIVVLVCALTLRNYWALVVGMVVGSVVGVILSYAMHPFRPRVSVARMKEIWSFSQWLLISRVGFFLNGRIDQFIVGRVGGADALGNYYIGYELGTMFTSDIVMPMRRALFPNYATMLDDPDRFAATLTSMLGILGFLCLSIGFGLSAVAADFVVVVYGNNWAPAAQILEWLAIYGSIVGLACALEVTLLVSGRAKLSAFESWGQLLILVPALLLVALAWGAEWIPMVRTVVALAFLPLMLLLVSRAIPVTMSSLVGVLWRPTLAALVMYAGVRTLHLDGLAVPALTLLIDVATGVILYPLAAVALWMLAGRPEGPERTILDYLMPRLRARLKLRSPGTEQ